MAGKQAAAPLSIDTGPRCVDEQEECRDNRWPTDVVPSARQAKVISGNTASVGRSAFAVYKDINGVRRKALLKIATGTIKARAVSVEEKRDTLEVICFRDSCAECDFPPSLMEAR